MLKAKHKKNRFGSLAHYIEKNVAITDLNYSALRLQRIDFFFFLFVCRVNGELLQS